MKAITINRKEYNISAPLERAIMEVWQYGPRAISDFSEGRFRRHRVNHVASSARHLSAMTGGALHIVHVGAGEIPDECTIDRPRVRQWVLPVTTRRINLVARKLQAMK